jgi:hypothetical protein
MKFNHFFFRLRNLPISIILVSLTVSCAGIKSPNNDVVVSQSRNPLSSASETYDERITLNDQRDLVNIDKLLLQVNRAPHKNKEFALGLLEDGIRLTEQDIKEGLHGQRSGLSKLFCAGAIIYPTVDLLTGCAESIVLGDSGFDVKLKKMKTASEIYRATLEFAERTNSPLPPAERQRILNNIMCLESFVKSQKPNSLSCELVKISLSKAPGIVKPNRTGIAY